jgi:hypothetical protein
LVVDEIVGMIKCDSSGIINQDYLRRKPMIVWRGWGYLVFVITLGVLILMEVGTGRLFHDSNYYAAHGWPRLLGFLVAAVAVWFLGTYLNRRAERAEGNKPVHSLFFIRVDYWAGILVVLGIVSLFIRG